MPVLPGGLLQRREKCRGCRFRFFFFINFCVCEVTSAIYLCESYIRLTKNRRTDHFKGATRCCVLSSNRSYTNNVIRDGGSHWVRVALVGELGKLN